MDYQQLSHGKMIFGNRVNVALLQVELYTLAVTTLF